MERTYYSATLTVFYDTAAADNPISADLQLEKHYARDRDLDGPANDYISHLRNLTATPDEPLLSDPRWKERNGRDSIEERADDGGGEPNYWLEYTVSDGLDDDGNPTYECSDWILPIFEADKLVPINQHKSILLGGR
jgi:hypothetical protein